MSNKMKVTIGIAVIVLFCIGLGAYLFNKKVPGLEGVTADYSLSANELFDAFDSNEAEALKKFENKVLAVNGEVISIKSAEGKSNIILKAENALAGGINCSFNEIVQEVNQGDKITVKGRCQGFLMDVVLNNCVKE